jgi:vacuolar-type H+-ATPase subunit H
MTHDDQQAPAPPPIPGALLDMLERARYDLALLLDGLIAEVDEARTMPLSNSIVVGKEDFLDKLDTAKANLLATMGAVLEDLPEELRAARWMVRERESYVARTNEKAREVIAKAKQRSQELLSESYIVEEAVAEANALVRNAENEARRIRLEAEDRAERRLADAETILGELLQDIRAARSQLHQSLPAGPQAPAGE